MAIKRVQSRATKLILKCDFSIPYPERLVKLGLLPLEFRREVLDLCFFSNVFVDILTLTYVSFKSSRYSMGNSEAELSKVRFRTDIFKFSFFNRIVDLWNGLPVAIRISDQLSLFSNNILITNSNKERFLFIFF